MEKKSLYSESFAGKSGRNGVSEAGGNSDSGDSVFITQAHKPGSAQSWRQRSPTLGLNATFSANPVNKDATSPVCDDGESDTDGEKKENVYRLPKHCFSFLTEKKGRRSTEMAAQQNRKLHYKLMGNYFKCVRELWKSYEKGQDLVASRPTIDTVGDHIAPISEEEEVEELEDKDIKVVAKKHFVVPSKAKRSKVWCSLEENGQTRRPSVAGFKSQGRQKKREEKEKDLTWKRSSTIAPYPTKKRTNDLKSSDAVFQEGKTSDKCVTSDKNLEAQPEPQNKKRTLKRAKRNTLNQKENEKELDSSSSATVCEPSPKKSVKRGNKGSEAVTEPQSDGGTREREPESQNLFRGGGDDDTLCSEARVKKRRKKKKDNSDHEGEEGGDQSQKEVEAQHAEASVSLAIAEVEEAQSLSQAIDEPDLPKSKRKKKRKKNNKFSTEDARQDVDGHTDGKVEDDSVLNTENGNTKKKGKKKESVTEDARQDVDGHTDGSVGDDSVLNAENGDAKKKRKRKSIHMDVEELKTNTLAEHFTDNSKILKKKRKKELNETSDLPQIPTELLKEMGDCLENAFVYQTLESSHIQRKKPKKKKLSAFSENHLGEGTCTDADFNNDGTNLSESTGLSVKKKKVSKTCMDVSSTPEEDKNADDAQKTTEALEEQDAVRVTKKKKRKKEKVSINKTEDTETTSDYSVSARKKEKKKKTSSFLVADEEEKASQRDGGKCSHSQSVAARDSYAEKPDVSQGCFMAKAAEITGSVGKSEKKKKKRSAAEENVERETECEGPKETGQRVLSETGVRKKKKHKRNESELISSTERLESAADVEDSQTDEAVVLRKKKKKKKDKQTIPPDAIEDPETDKSTQSFCASRSPKKKNQRDQSSEMSHESSFCNDQEMREPLVQDTSLSLSTSGNKALGENKKKKKEKEKAASKHLLEVKSSLNSAEVKTPKTEKKKRKEPTADGRLSSSLSKTSLSQLETSSSNSIREKKDKKRLNNPKNFL